VIAREVRERPLEGSILNNIGVVYRQLAKYPKALEFYQQALEIRKQVGNRFDVGSTLSNIGVVYRYLAEYPRH